LTPALRASIHPRRTTSAHHHANPPFFLHRISIPTMTNLTQGSITSELPLDCNEVYKVWDQEHPIRNGFSCTGYVKKQFPRGAKIGIGAGIPIFIALCIGVVYLCVKLRRRRKAAAEAAVAAAAAKIVQPVEDVFRHMS
jgi:hypothetical protein